VILSLYEKEQKMRMCFNKRLFVEKVMQAAGSNVQGVFCIQQATDQDFLTISDFSCAVCNCMQV